MARIKGTVSKVGKSEYSYYIRIEGDERYFNTKFEPKCGEGDVVGIEYEPKGDKRANIKKVKMFEQNSAGYAASQPEEKSYSAPTGGGGSNRSESIVFQSSRKDALVLVGILLGAEAFATKGKTDERRVQIEELLDELTAKFYHAAIDPAKSAVLTGAQELAGDVATDSEPDDWGDDKAPASDDGWED